MVSDYLSKLLQGSLFWVHCNTLMGIIPAIIDRHSTQIVVRKEQSIDGQGGKGSFISLREWVWIEYIYMYIHIHEHKKCVVIVINNISWIKECAIPFAGRACTS